MSAATAMSSVSTRCARVENCAVTSATGPMHQRSRSDSECPGSAATHRPAPRFPARPRCRSTPGSGATSWPPRRGRAGQGIPVEEPPQLGQAGVEPVLGDHRHPHAGSRAAAISRSAASSVDVHGLLDHEVLACSGRLGADLAGMPARHAHADTSMSSRDKRRDIWFGSAAAGVGKRRGRPASTSVTATSRARPISLIASARVAAITLPLTMPKPGPSPVSHPAPSITASTARRCSAISGLHLRVPLLLPFNRDPAGLASDASIAGTGTVRGRTAEAGQPTGAAVPAATLPPAPAGPPARLPTLAGSCLSVWMGGCPRLCDRAGGASIDHRVELGNDGGTPRNCRRPR